MLPRLKFLKVGMLVENVFIQGVEDFILVGWVLKHVHNTPRGAL